MKLQNTQDDRGRRCRSPSKQSKSTNQLTIRLLCLVNGCNMIHPLPCTDSLCIPRMFLHSQCFILIQSKSYLATRQPPPPSSTAISNCSRDRGGKLELQHNIMLTPYLVIIMSKSQLSQAQDTPMADHTVRCIKDHALSGQSLLALSPKRHAQGILG